VRYIFIILSVFIFSLTVISCKSSDDDDDLTSSASSSSDIVSVSDSGGYIQIESTNHSLDEGDVIRFTTTDTLPTGLALATDYYVVGAPSTNTFFVSATESGTPIVYTDGGTGTHSWQIAMSSTGLFVTVGDNGIILTSSDGISWTKRTSGTTKNLYGVTYGNSTFVTVGDNGTILTSSDGTTWTERDGLRSTWATPKYLKGVTYRKKLFVAVGRNGLILNSPDGITWKQRKSGTKYNLVGITYTSSCGKAEWKELFGGLCKNGIFVGVGKNGKIVTSFDGNWWVKRTYVLPTWLNGVTYGNGTFVTVGDNGVILTSFDGISWTKRTSGGQPTTTTIVSVSDSGGNIQIESTNHNLDEGDVIRFTTTDTLPTGLALATDYYVVGTPATNTFFVSATESGTPIVYTDAGTGTHSWQNAIALNRIIEQYDGRTRASFSVTSVTTNILNAVTYSNQ